MGLAVGRAVPLHRKPSNRQKHKTDHLTNISLFILYQMSSATIQEQNAKVYFDIFFTNN